MRNPMTTFQRIIAFIIVAASVARAARGRVAADNHTSQCQNKKSHSAKLHQPRGRSNLRLFQEKKKRGGHHKMATRPSFEVCHRPLYPQRNTYLTCWLY